MFLLILTTSLAAKVDKEHLIFQTHRNCITSCLIQTWLIIQNFTCLIRQKGPLIILKRWDAMWCRSLSINRRFHFVYAHNPVLSCKSLFNMLQFEFLVPNLNTSSTIKSAMILFLVYEAEKTCNEIARHETSENIL